MEKHDKKFTVILVAPVKHIMPGITNCDAQAAAEHAAKLAAGELEEFYGKELPPWYATAQTAVDTSQPLTLRVHEESAPDDAGDTLWRITEDGKVVPLLSQMEEARAFIRHFLECYQQAVLFAWDDKAMGQLYQEASRILCVPVVEMERPKGKKTKKAKSEPKRATAS